MRIKTAFLISENLKRFKEITDLDHHSLQVVIEKAEIFAADKGGKLLDCAFNDSCAFFLLQGSIQLHSGYLKKEKVSAANDSSRSMLNHLLPKGGRIIAIENNSAILSIKKKYIHIARLEYNKPLDNSKQAFDLKDSTLTQEEEHNDWMSTLLNSPLFHRIKPNKLQQLFNHLEEKEYKAGETIIKQGQPDQYFYIIKSGKACVEFSIPTPGTASLEPGHFFGEGALTGNGVHSATVVMEESGLICLVHIKQFEELLKNTLLEYLDDSQLDHILFSDNETALVLDVRHAIEYRHEHRERSINIPIYKLRHSVQKDLSTEITYLIDYGDDKRSQVAALILIENGFKAFLIGSTENHKEKNYA